MKKVSENSNQSLEEIFSFLGERVAITYSYGDEKQPATIAIGTFLGFATGGNFEILEDDGFVHYGWPLLRIEKVDQDYV